MKSGTKHHLRDVYCMQDCLGHFYIGRDLDHRFRNHSLQHVDRSSFDNHKLCYADNQ